MKIGGDIQSLEQTIARMRTLRPHLNIYGSCIDRDFWWQLQLNVQVALNKFHHSPDNKLVWC